MKYKNTIRQIILPVIYAVLLIVGMFIGRLTKPNNSLDFSGGRLIINSQTNKIETILNLISDRYVDSIDKQELTKKLIPDILKHLDPHSNYMSAEEVKEANEGLQGHFGGIGIEFNMQNDTVFVIRVIPSGPSEKVGIIAGDRIVSVNDSIIAGVKMNSNKVMKLLKGDIGTIASVKVVRRNVKEMLEFEIIRGIIPVYSVDVSYMMTESTGYIKISRFARTTYQEFLTAMAKLKAHGCTDLIVDLRENDGGFLDVAMILSNEFLKKGDLIVYTEGKSHPRQNMYANGLGSCQNIGITVLIDEFSASASEIFAGAIQDNDRGVIVGRRSYGKGLVQEPFPLPDGSELRLTIARYYTPSGRCIQKPYESGIEDYHRDIFTRIMHGEMFERDSIVFDEELRYTTKNGRVVFGGGGIMPDVFVPRDTSDVTDFYFIISRYVYPFALRYSDENRSNLQQLNNSAEISDYLDSKEIMNELIRYAEKEGVKINHKELKQSYKLINTQLKAYIARNIINSEGFYPIIYDIDEIAKEAVSVIESGRGNEILNPTSTNQ